MLSCTNIPLHTFPEREISDHLFLEIIHPPWSSLILCLFRPTHRFLVGFLLLIKVYRKKNKLADQVAGRFLRVCCKANNSASSLPLSLNACPGGVNAVGQ